jgi:hypothetical protein
MKRSEQQKEKGGQDCQDSRPVYFRESHVQLRTMLLIPRSLAAAACRNSAAKQRRLLYIVVLALLCFGGCSSPSFPVRYVRIPFGAIGKAGHARAARRFFRSGSSHDFSDCGVGGVGDGSVSFSVTPE